MLRYLYIRDKIVLRYDKKVYATYGFSNGGGDCSHAGK